MPNKTIIYLSIIAISIGLIFLANGLILAFLGPSANPPTGSGAISVDSAGNVGIGTTGPEQKLHIVGTGYATGDFRAPIFYDTNNTGYYVDPAGTSKFNTINLGGVSRSTWPSGEGGGWKLLAKGNEWTEEAIITLSSTGATFQTDQEFSNQRVNIGTFNWPEGPVEEIIFKVFNPGDNYCVGGGFKQNLVSGVGSQFPKCQDFRYQGTTLTRVNVNEDDGIKLVINGVDMDYCPDQYGRKSNNPTYPGTEGETHYFSPICYYRAGVDYASSDITKIEVKEVDWSPAYSMWQWEIWWR